MVQNPMQMIRQFNQFRQSFNGDPKQEVEKLVREGKVSQQQLNRLQAMASEFQKLLK